MTGLLIGPRTRYPVRIMFKHMRRLIGALKGWHTPFHRFTPPADPYAPVREPRRSGPPRRSSGVALAEPDPVETVRAVGTGRRSSAFAVLLAAGLAASAAYVQAQGNVTEKPFASGGRIDVQLDGGEYEIRAAADNRIRVTLNGSVGGAKVELAAAGTQGTLKITNTPHNGFRAVIEVPKAADLIVRLSAGNIAIGAIAGSKDVESYAGNVKIVVPDANQYSSVDAAVKAGDIDANVFGGSKSGLFQTFKWSGKGKYTLRAHLGAGNLELPKQ